MKTATAAPRTKVLDAPAPESAPLALVEDTQQPGLPTVQGTSLLEAITQAASNPAMDIDKMERLWAMHEKMVEGEKLAAFNDAMARAQLKIQPIVTNAENDHTNSKYATLAAINKAIVPIYSAEGLSVTFDTETVNAADPIPPGFLRTVAYLSHRNGYVKRYHIDLPPDSVGAKGNTNKTGVQAAGSTNEYARRYLMRMMFNISTYDDTDGSGEVGQSGNKGPVPDPDGKAALELCGSIDALKKCWSGLTPAQRKTLEPVMTECSRKIHAADKTQ